MSTTTNTRTLTVTLKVEVDLEAYRAEYGWRTQTEAAVDAKEHLPYIVTDAAGAALERLGYAKVVRTRP